MRAILKFFTFYLWFAFVGIILRYRIFLFIFTLLLLLGFGVYLLIGSSHPDIICSVASTGAKTPIDGGLSLLAGAGIVYGYKKIKSKKQK